jgi:hypothetical protein
MVTRSVVYRGPWPDIPIPSVPVTAFVFEGVESRASKTALIDGVTGRNFYEAPSRRAPIREGLGIAGSGRDVRRLLSNVVEYAVIFTRRLDRRHRDHHQPALHTLRARTAAQGREREVPSHHGQFPCERA